MRTAQLIAIWMLIAFCVFGLPIAAWLFQWWLAAKIFGVM
jgi:hypothetical protein